MQALLHQLFVAASVVAQQAPQTPQLAYLEIQRAHSTPVQDVAITPDDRWLVTTDSVETKIWDLGSGRVLRRYESTGQFAGSGRAHTFWWEQRKALAIAGVDAVILLDPLTLEERVRLVISGGDALFLDDSGTRLFRTSPWGDLNTPGGLAIRELKFGKLKRNEDAWGLSWSGVDAFPQGTHSGGDLVALGGNRFLVSTVGGAHHRLLKLGEWMELAEPAQLGTGRTARGSDGQLYLFSIEGNGAATQGRVKRLSPADFSVLAQSSFPLADGAVELAPRSRDFLDRDGKLLLRTHKELVDVDLATLTATSVRPHGLGATLALESSAVAHKLDVWVGTSGGRVFVVRGSSPAKELAPRLIPAGPLLSSPVDDEVFMGSWRIALQPSGVVARDLGFDTARLSISADGKSTARPEPGTRKLRVGSLKSPERATRVLPSQDAWDDPIASALSTSGRLLALRSTTAVSIIDTRQDAVLWSPRELGMYVLEPETATIALSPDERRCATVGLVDGGWKLSMLDLAAKKTLWSEVLRAQPLHLEFLGNEVLALIVNDVPGVGVDFICRLATTGKSVMAQRLFHTPLRDSPPSALSADGERFATLEYGRLRVVESAVRRLFVDVQPREGVVGLAFLRDPRFLVLSFKSGALELWDLDLPRPVASIAVFEDGQWIVAGADVRFAASAGAADRVAFVQGNRNLPLESYFERFHTPDLVGELLALGGDAPPPVVPVLTAPPSLKLSQDGTRNDGAEVKLVARVKSSGPAIAEVRLFHNGKLVEQSTRGLVVEDDELDVGESLHRWTVALVPGDNAFRAVAIDETRTESGPSEVLLAGPASAAPTGIRLHLLVVGINHYRNSKYDLNYAVDDARAFCSRLAERSAGIVSSVEVQEIYDADAQRAKIVAALERVQGTSGKNDVFVFYYAGHGVMSSESEPRFYLAPHDVTQLYGDDESLARLAISAAELREFSRKIPAQKQLYLLDACQSAGALDAVAARGAAEEKAIAQLARSTGTHWITASGSQQFASEVKSLGHGVFTYVLLDALGGSADSGDGRVSVNELKAFLEAQVPEVSRSHKGALQFPASYGFGQDFPLVLVAR